MVDSFINHLLDEPFQLTPYQAKLCEEINKGTVSGNKILYPRHDEKTKLQYFMNEVSKAQYKGESDA